VVIVSDGWDTGEIEVLEGSMKAMRTRAGRVIWLNALLGNPAYEPSCRGMQAALPYIDHFAAAHNLDSLRRFAETLAGSVSSRAWRASVSRAAGAVP
jgi:hypothetical protein